MNLGCSGGCGGWPRADRGAGTNTWICSRSSPALALLFGVLLIIPIGGADMPTVIALLNSYAGLSACAMGFVLDNKLLIDRGRAGRIVRASFCRSSCARR